MAKHLKDIFGQHHGLDSRSVEALTKALEKKNLPGFDYLEYKQSLDALTQLGIDEATAFKSAFATAATMGLTKEKLLQTAQHYKKVLLEEKTQFDNSVQRQLEQRVEGKRREVEMLKKKVAEYQQKIQQLEAQIRSSQETIDQADATIAEAREKIEGAKDNFDHTLQSMINDIDKDISNIQTFL